MTDPNPTGWGVVCPIAIAKMRQHRRLVEARRLASEQGCDPVEAATISGAGRAYIEVEAHRLATAERCSVPEIALMLGLRQTDARRIVRGAA